eukprot:jgi/Ulvmu1/2194/UM013_0040.1
MKHETEAGHPAHTVNDTHHLRRFTEEVDRLIIEQLGMPVKPAAIIAAVKDWVLAKVDATDAMSAEERMHAVRSSVYAKDLLTDHNGISRLRRKLSATEPEEDREAQDADSCRPSSDGGQAEAVSEPAGQVFTLSQAAGAETLATLTADVGRVAGAGLSSSEERGAGLSSSEECGAGLSPCMAAAAMHVCTACPFNTSIYPISYVGTT